MHQNPFRARTWAMLLLGSLALQSGMAARATNALLAPLATPPAGGDPATSAVISGDRKSVV
jgi:hypothetical protein